MRRVHIAVACQKEAEVVVEGEEVEVVIMGQKRFCLKVRGKLFH
eukprot:jgi/Chlat1/5545/Chrsp369S00839